VETIRVVSAVVICTTRTSKIAKNCVWSRYNTGGSMVTVLGADSAGVVGSGVGVDVGSGVGVGVDVSVDDGEGSGDGVSSA
jgi:hypothetical protein